INCYPVPLWQLPPIATVARVKLYTLFPFQFGPGPDFNLASTLYRASPIDPALKPGSSPEEGDFPYDLSVETSTRQPSSGSAPFSTNLPDIKSVTKFGSIDSDGYPGSSVSTSLPGLAALASVASAPTSNLRFVETP
ncbi:uncharacterized protein N7506_002390, partial [Penicillium brevicompactum]|uniref:uncharacterized protein n=1 Tax=Penicillium brevicompactum TaxID=5074 RepID=UPI00253FC339